MLHVSLVQQGADISMQDMHPSGLYMQLRTAADVGQDRETYKRNLQSGNNTYAVAAAPP